MTDRGEQAQACVDQIRGDAAVAALQSPDAAVVDQPLEEREDLLFGKLALFEENQLVVLRRVGLLKGRTNDEQHSQAGQARAQGRPGAANGNRKAESPGRDSDGAHGERGHRNSTGG
jgi:hypothetical protein